MYAILPVYCLVLGWVVYRLIRRKRYDILTHLGFIASVVYLGMWASFGSGFIDYRESISATAIGYLTAAFAVFGVGTLVGGHIPVSGTRSRTLPTDSCELMIYVGGLLGTIGMMAYVANFYISGLASLDASTARGAVMAEGVAGNAILAKIGHYFGPCGLITALLAVMTRHRLSLGAKLFACAGFMSGPAYAISMVGRMTILPTVGAVALLALLHRSRGGKFVFALWEKSLIALVGILGVAYMLILPLFRISEQDQVAHTLDVLNSDPSPYLVQVQDHLNASSASVFVQAIAYTSQQPVMFSRFWESADVGPYWGLWQFSNIANRVFRKEVIFQDIRQEIHEQSNALGLFGNTWSTAVRDAIVDFGVIGGMIQLFIFGLGGGYFRARYLATGALGAGLNYAFFAGWIAFSFSVSATTLGYYEMFLLGSVILYCCGFGSLVPELPNAVRAKERYPGSAGFAPILKSRASHSA